MGNLEGEPIFSLIKRFVSLVRKFLKQEKTYVKEVGTGALKTGLPVLALGGACLVLVALGGIFSLVTIVLLLNTWFVPWVSALIVTASLLLIGLILGGTALLMAKKGAREARKHLSCIQEDMRWLKKS
jgi:uncharacterized membrane protein YqjE